MEGFEIKYVKNVVTRPYTFRVQFRDGREEIVTVEAESYQAAKLLLPQDKKLYWYLKPEKK